MASGRAWWLLVLVPGQALGSSADNQQIPNGSCVQCHTSGADLNLFGAAVGTNRAGHGGAFFSWPELHALDSDADGFTNGEELGDPCGVWLPGASPAHSTGLGNPGLPQLVPPQHTAGECPSSSSSSAAPSSSEPGSSSAGEPPSSSGEAPSSSAEVPDGGSPDANVVATSSSAAGASSAPTASSGQAGKPKSRGQDDDPMNPLGGCVAAGLGGLPVSALTALLARRRRRR